MSPLQPESPVREGEVIADKYRVERVLGVGGMGVVVAAMHLELEERVALKFLLPAAAQNPAIAARFAQEARAAAKIKSEHVARVIDVGKLAGGAPFMVLEYLDGEDLERVLLAHGPLPVAPAVGYVLQASEAIAEAHARGIVHRDLKPANLFLARRPNGPPIVKVLDFGISKAAASTSAAQLTKTSSVLGSPFYMSPEQMSAAKSVDPRADIWALGVVLYELLSGKRPFEGGSMPELVASILQSAPAPVRSLRPDLPPALAAAIMRCLEKDPSQRFGDVYQLALALAPFAPETSATSLARIAHVLVDRDGLASGARPAPWNLPASTVAGVSQSSSDDVPGVGRRNLLVGLLSAIGVFVAVGVTFALLQRQPTPIAAPGLVGEVLPAPPVSASQPAASAPRAESVPPASAGAAPAPSPPVPEAPPAAIPAASAHATGHSKAAEPTAGGRKSPPRVDCDPPYVIDPATGHRQYKPECLE